MEVRIIKHGSAEYDHVVALRLRVLRRPLGLDFTLEQLAAEAPYIHVAGFEGEEAVACLILERAGAREFKMRQVAVAPERQGEGLGSLLVAYAEETARLARAETMSLLARETAIPFYLRLGYVPEGEIFEQVGLPHRKMVKCLS